MGIKNSKLRAVVHARPKGRRYPLATECAYAKLAKIAARPHSLHYSALFDSAPVRAGHRQRAKRSDGAQNMITLLQTLVLSADLQNGYIATPLASSDFGRTTWERKTYAQLDGLAFGERVEDERSFKRTERAATDLAKMGLIRCVEWRQRQFTAGQGVEFKSKPGLKFIQDKLWKLLGVLHLVKAERRRREREKGEARAAALLNSLTPSTTRGRTTCANSADIPFGNVPEALRAVLEESPQLDTRKQNPLAETAFQALREFLLA